jgi:hypothetical protein
MNLLNHIAVPGLVPIYVTVLRSSCHLSSVNIDQSNILNTISPSQIQLQHEVTAKSDLIRNSLYQWHGICFFLIVTIKFSEAYAIPDHPLLNSSDSVAARY